MIWHLEIKEEAKQDILQASEWYAAKASDLNLKFIEQIELTLKAIQGNPKIFKKIYKSFRQAAVKKFPYVVLYEYNQNAIIVFSIFHTSRNPRKKLIRLRK